MPRPWVPGRVMTYGMPPRGLSAPSFTSSQPLSCEPVKALLYFISVGQRFSAVKYWAQFGDLTIRSPVPNQSLLLAFRLPGYCTHTHTHTTLAKPALSLTPNYSQPASPICAPKMDDPGSPLEGHGVCVPHLCSHVVFSLASWHGRKTVRHSASSRMQVHRDY
ncbi:hypothetical protein LX36DRAFT_99238 [Colletotrichum falcatum]|nr:hypothetical protein LX36DRAFT_99238 [Colletotrichum falcatum]